MHRTVGCISSQPLAHKVEWDAQRDKEEAEGGIRHDGIHVTDLDDPDVQELGHPVGPEVLVDRGGDQKFTGYRLIGIDLKDSQSFSPLAEQNNLAEMVGKA